MKKSMKKVSTEPDDSFAFNVGGVMFIDKKHTPIKDCMGNTVGFELPDGRQVKLIVGLEIEDSKGGLSYITSDKDMHKIGFDLTDYTRADFDD